MNYTSFQDQHQKCIVLSTLNKKLNKRRKTSQSNEERKEIKSIGEEKIRK